MSKIPTTDTILKKHLVKALEAGKTSSEDRANAINDAMKEFGELVREETLKVVAKEAKTKTHEEYISKSGEKVQDVNIATLIKMEAGIHLQIVVVNMM